MSKIIFIIITIFYQNTSYSIGEMSAFDASLLEENYNAFIGDLNFPIADFMENVEIKDITNKAKKGVDTNHFVTGISHIVLKVPTEIMGREIISADLERVGNKLNKAILGGNGCSLFIYSYLPGRTEFEMIVEVSIPKQIFNTIDFSQDQNISKSQSDIMIKKCIRRTLRNDSFNLKVSLPVRLGLKEKKESFEQNNFVTNKTQTARAISNP